MAFKFKVLIIMAILAAMTSCSAKRTPGAAAPAWQLAWADEFNGPSIDTNIWGYDLGGGGWGNAELETYTSNSVNAYIENGNLVIQALDEAGNTTSARLKTQDKKYMAHGKVEASIKLPYGKGLWPAFWLLGNDISSVGWPACGEIDILEMIGGGSGFDNRYVGTAHWDDGGHKSSGSNSTVPWPEKLADAYHVYGIEWDASYLKWYFDGTLYYTLDITPAAMSELHGPMFVILNVAVGGAWPGSPDGTTVFPQKMYVDWVRWYEWK